MVPDLAWFECPVHGSQYNRVGEEGGPAPRGLDRFVVTSTAGTLMVDTKQGHPGAPDRHQHHGPGGRGPIGGRCGVTVPSPSPQQKIGLAIAIVRHRRWASSTSSRPPPNGGARVRGFGWRRTGGRYLARRRLGGSRARQVLMWALAFSRCSPSASPVLAPGAVRGRCWYAASTSGPIARGHDLFTPAPPPSEPWLAQAITSGARTATARTPRRVTSYSLPGTNPPRQVQWQWPAAEHGDVALTTRTQTRTKQTKRCEHHHLRAPRTRRMPGGGVSPVASMTTSRSAT